MSSKAKLTILLAFTLSLISCSGIPLQTKRLDKVETNLNFAESALQRSQPSLAQEAFGEANAYLLTVRDNKKYLSDSEKKRYEQLKQRTDSLSTRMKRL